MAGRLQADPLFQGLTRPAMIAGVTIEYFALNGMFTMLAFVLTKDFTMLFMVGPIIHVIGVAICRKEPRAITFLIVRSQTAYRSWNNIMGYHHNTSSYDVY